MFFQLTFKTQIKPFPPSTSRSASAKMEMVVAPNHIGHPGNCHDPEPFRVTDTQAVTKHVEKHLWTVSLSPDTQLLGLSVV